MRELSDMVIDVSYEPDKDHELSITSQCGMRTYNYDFTISLRQNRDANECRRRIALWHRGRSDDTDILAVRAVYDWTSPVLVIWAFQIDCVLRKHRPVG